MLRRKLKVCSIDQLPNGRAVSFRYGVSNGIAYNDGGTIRAYVNRCTHMGGPVQLISADRATGPDCERCVFRCGWHRAEFDPKTGMRVSGQAPEGTALTPIPLEVTGDEVWAVLEIRDEFG